MVWRIKILRKSCSLLGQANTLDQSARKTTSFMGPFCCILYRKAEANLDHLLWDCHYAQAAQRFFLPEFDVWIAIQQDVRAMIREFLHPSFEQKDRFLWFAMVCALAVSWDMWGERNIRKSRLEIVTRYFLFLVRFHVFIWGSVLKLFCNYSLGNIYIFGTPSFSMSVLVGLFFCMPLYSFFFLNENCFIYRQIKKKL